MNELSVTEQNDVWRQEKAVRLNLLLDVASVMPVLAVAMLANSMLLLTDVFDYAKNIIIYIVSFLILRRIRQGRTKEYEYGPEKMEVLGSAFAACLMLLGVVVMAGVIIQRIIYPEQVVPSFGVIGIVMHVVSTGINGWLWHRNKRIAEETSGPIIDAAWRGHRADTIMNIAVIISMSLTLSMHHHTWSVYIDPVCALAALLYPAGAFVEILRRSLNELTDKTLDETIQLQIMKHLANCYDGYESFHGVRSRRAGRRLYVEIMIGFHRDRPVGEMMETVHHLKRGLENDIPGVVVSVVPV